MEDLTTSIDGYIKQKKEASLNHYGKKLCVDDLNQKCDRA